MGETGSACAYLQGSGRRGGRFPPAGFCFLFRVVFLQKPALLKLGVSSSITSFPILHLTFHVKWSPSRVPQARIEMSEQALVNSENGEDDIEPQKPKGRLSSSSAVEKRRPGGGLRKKEGAGWGLELASQLSPPPPVDCWMSFHTSDSSSYWLMTMYVYFIVKWSLQNYEHSREK